MLSGRDRDMGTAIYCLAKGHSSFFGYRMLVRRNWSLRRVRKLNPDAQVTFIIFHEGNIGLFHRALISFFSALRIRWVDISEDFQPFSNQDLPADTAILGYSLMCRFQYLQIWKYLTEFDVAVRVDDDCKINSIPLQLAEGQVFQTGFLIVDGHEPTNTSLPKILGPSRIQYWDDLVPYTNVLMTKVSFWMRPDVTAFLKEVGEHDFAVRDRWGDAPVMGLVLRMFADWDAESGVDKLIDYYHDSHRARVSGGELSWIPKKKKGRLRLRLWFDRTLGGRLQQIKLRASRRLGQLR
jgi:hypothetical protein